VRHGQGYSRFVEEKTHGPKKRRLGPHVVFDWERCIKCTRCIRFTDEVTGTGELDMFLRGVREEIGVFPGRPLDNAYSGNVVDICPVGALTLSEFRFRSRVWFLKDWPSVCTGCARGCSVNLGVHENQIMRMTPRENHAVNRWWMCDEGRLSYRRLAGERLAGPPGGEGWEAAFADVVAALRAPGRVAVLASPRASNEELYLLARIAADRLGGAPVHLAVHDRGEDDGLLIRADRAPNRRGAETILGAVAGGAQPVSALEEALEAGGVDVLLVLGPNLHGVVPDEAPPLAPERAARAGRLIVLDAFSSPLSDRAATVVPCQHLGEQEGTVTNFAGRVQRVAAPLAPTADAWPLLAILAELAGGLDVEGPWGSPEAVFGDLVSRVPAFAALSWDSIAGTGADLDGAEGADLACPPTGATAAKREAGA
jgi:NADH-quinone oxidoreductase subunit G